MLIPLSGGSIPAFARQKKIRGFFLRSAQDRLRLLRMTGGVQCAMESIFSELLRDCPGRRQIFDSNLEFH
jgi:hypothetical protein